MSKAERLTRREASARTRERLLEAARVVFVRRGYEAASIYEIAEEAGFTIGALYGHFGGKEGLFLALLDRHFADQMERFSAELGEMAETDDPIAVGSEFWTEFLARDPDLVVLFVEFWSVAIRNPELRPRLATSLRRLRESLAGFIDQRQQELGLSGDPSPADVAMVLDALIDGFALHKLADPDGVPDELLVRALSWIRTGMLAETAEQRALRRGRV
jgi:AcrR family transcriptional regulator